MRLYFAFCLLLNSLFSCPGNAKAINLSGNWQYESSNDKANFFTHRYALDDAKTVLLTPAMSLNGSIHATRNIAQNSTLDTLSPTLGYQLTNDAFSYNLIGTMTKRLDSRDAIGVSDNLSKSLQMNWQSRWQANGLTPNVQLLWGEDWSTTDNSNADIHLDWRLSMFNIFSSYNHSKNSDETAGNSSKSDSYAAGVDASKTFWHDKLNLSFSQRYSQNDRQTTRKTTSNGTVLLPVTISQTFSSELDPDINTALPLELDPANNLMNGDTRDNAVTVNNPVAPLKMNVGVKVDFQTVSVVYLYTNTTLGSEQNEFNNWAVYSSPDNNNWSLSETLTNVSYEPLVRRFTLNFRPLSVDFIKIVPLITPLTTAVTFSEIEVFNEVKAEGNFADINTTDKQYLTNLNLALQINHDLRLSSSLSYQKTDHSNGKNIIREDFGSALGWNPNVYFLSSLTVGLSNTKLSETPSTSNRSLGLQISVPPLPTVNTSVGVSLSESYRGSIKESTNVNYNLTIAADLYTDLHANFSNNYTINTNSLTSTEQTQFSSNMALTARLSPKLLADMHSTYNDGSGEKASETLNLNLNWHPSDILNGSISSSNAWREEYTSSIAASIGIVPSSKTQITFSNSYIITPSHSSNYNLNFQWNINDFLDFSTYCAYNTSDTGDTWRVFSNLNAAYTIF